MKYKKFVKAYQNAPLEMMAGVVFAITVGMALFYLITKILPQLYNIYNFK